MAGKKKGTKNLRPIAGSYDIGNPSVNLFLAVLAQAKRDASKTIPKVISSKYQQREKAFILSGKRMWQAFQDSEFYGKQAIAPLEVAWWICKYIQEVRNA